MIHISWLAAVHSKAPSSTNVHLNTYHLFNRAEIVRYSALANVKQMLACPFSSIQCGDRLALHSRLAPLPL